MKFSSYLGYVDRQMVRRRVSALLAEDARVCPAFTVARQAVVLASFDHNDRQDTAAVDLLRVLHAYEAARGPGRRPAETPEARRAAADVGLDLVDVYERSRTVSWEPR